MTLFMIAGMVLFAAVLFLLWCLNAFSGELKHSKTVSAEVAAKPMFVSREVFKQNARRVIQMQRRRDTAHSNTLRQRNTI